jgi:membrane associated rhomboid family serine protease
MLFFFPTGTDAPIYHWPFATGGLILVNIVALILTIIFPESADWFTLHYGSLNPITWITSLFIHAGFGHLIGNIIGIALFGWIIEGKVGWWRFLLIYLAIGASSCAIEQCIMFFLAEGASFGASGVVFGLIAMAMIWAPENEVRITCCGILLFRPFAFNFDVSLSTLGFCMIGMEWLIAGITGFAISSAVLHLMGTVPGFLIAYFLLRWRWVNCDGYDLVSTMKGRRGKRVMTIAEERAEIVRDENAKIDARQEVETGLAMVEKYINAGHYDLAVNRFNMLKKRDRSLVMTERQFVTLIKAYDAEESTKLKTAPLLTSYLEHYDRHRIPFTLMLARIHVLMQDRPRQGIKVLKTLTWEDLNLKQKDFVRRLLDRAKHMIADGVLEVNEQ